MKKSKLDTPHIKEQIVKQLAAGASQADLSQQIGFDPSTISKFANREDIRILIEQEQTKLLEVVPDAVQNVKDLVEGMKGLAAKDSKGKELAYKASKDVLKSVGLLPAPVQSQTFINLTQQNIEIMSPVVMKVLGQHTIEMSSLPDDVIVEDKE